MLPFILFVGCSTKKNHPDILPGENEKKQQAPILNTKSSNGFSGTWVSNRANSFQIVEALDSNKATITRFQKWQHAGNEKISYEKFTGPFRVTYAANISIQTGRYTFCYFLKKDILFEMAEPGRVDTLLKVENGKVLEKLTPEAKK
jgi:hypothetical protein